VPRDAPGFTAREMKKKMMWRASNTGELFFDDCVVPKRNLLGKRGDGFRQMLSTLDGGRLSIGAMGLGGRRAPSRRPWSTPTPASNSGGRSLPSRRSPSSWRTWPRRSSWPEPSLQGVLAARARTRLREGGGHGEALLLRGHAALRAPAVQIHGGYGLMKANRIERFYRDQRILEIGEGTSEIQRIVIARTSVRRAAPSDPDAARGENGDGDQEGERTKPARKIVARRRRAPGARKPMTS